MGERSDQRLLPRAERVSINREFDSVDSLITEYVTNISTTGVFIRTDDPLAIGTKVNLRFTVIIDDVETIEGVGQVVRVSDNPRGMGVIFIDLDRISQVLVERMMARKVPMP